MNVSSILDKLFPSGSGGGSKCPPWIIIGLGNPGAEYKNTRHIVVCWCLDELVRRTNAQMNHRRKELRFGEVELDGNLLVLAYPQTLMNRSGRALRYLINRYKTAKVGFREVIDAVRTWEYQGLEVDPRVKRYQKILQSDIDIFIDI